MQQARREQVQLRNGMPPTPPMGSEASFDGYGSPSVKSMSGFSVQSTAHHNYYVEATPPLSTVEEETRPVRHHAQQPQPQMATSVPRVPVQMPYAQPTYGSPYMAQQSMAQYYPPMHATPPPQTHISGLYYQRPLPQVSPCKSTCQPRGLSPL